MVTEEQVNALVAYIKSISPAKGEAGKTSKTERPRRRATNRRKRSANAVRCNEYADSDTSTRARTT